MVRKNPRGNLIVISGASGCGKGTLCKRLVSESDNIYYSISMTSRQPRAEDKDGVTYYFVSNEEFERKIKLGHFLEYAKYNDNYYGTPKDKVLEYLDKGYDVILEIEIVGAMQVKKMMPEAIFVFIMPPSMRELKRRLISRKTETKEQIVDRFQTAYREINEASKYNYVIINDDIDDALRKLKAILVSEKCRVDRIEDFDLNTKEEMIHELLTVDLKDYKKD